MLSTQDEEAEGGESMQAPQDISQDPQQQRFDMPDHDQPNMTEALPFIGNSPQAATAHSGPNVERTLPHLSPSRFTSAGSGQPFQQDARTPVLTPAGGNSQSPHSLTTNLSPARVPAAGAGTRITPRPVPRSSSSLRHITNSKSRTSSFGAPVPEDRGLSSESPDGMAEASSSLVQRSMDAYNRKAALELEQEDFFAEEDELDVMESSMFGLHRREGTDTSLSLALEEEEGDSASTASSSSSGGISTGSLSALTGGAQDLSSGTLRPSQRRRGSSRNSRKGKEKPIDGDSADEGLKKNLRHKKSSSYRSRTDFHLTDSASSESDPLGEDGEQYLLRASRAGAASEAAPDKERASYLDARPLRGDAGCEGTGTPAGAQENASSKGGLDLYSPPLPGTSRLAAATPGSYFPHNLNAIHTPILEINHSAASGATPDVSSADPSPSGEPGARTAASEASAAAPPEFEPRQRLEWQTMLHSVLGSEVLRSETKRITSVDAPEMSRSEIVHQRWLEMRSYLRGRGHSKAALEAERATLTEGWPRMMQEVIQAVKDCRSKEALQRTQKEHEAANGSERDGVVASTSGGTLSSEENEHRIRQAQEEKERVFEEVGQLLARVDKAEEQFPSQRKIIEVAPEWGSPEIQDKLAALYSWYNIFSSLRLQISVLQKWTGSTSLEITSHPTSHPDLPPVANVTAEGEERSFVERLMKESNLKSTFEKRTLTALNALLLKARKAIKSHHIAFGEMDLPSFEPELVQLIGFPASLMEGALTLRLDYAGKLKEPSVLIVDSLTDDIRSALALACKVKLQYQSIMVPDPDNGWDLPQSLDDGYDAVLRDALRFFFRLLNSKLKGSVFFKETEILEPEWLFLSTAVSVINGGDVIVAKSITKIVNKLFARIVTYFERELSAPSTSRGVQPAVQGSAAAAAAKTSTGIDPQLRAPSTAGGLTKGKVRMTLAEKAKWIRAVFDNVRIRSRKLLGFARDVRARLDNAAEYDLTSLAPVRTGSSDGEASKTHPPGTPMMMDLSDFMQKLSNAGFFLVYTWSLEESGTYLIADPTLADKPELIRELLCKCLRRIQRNEGEDARTMEASATVLEEPLAPEGHAESRQKAGSDEHEDVVSHEGCHYLLLLSPREDYLWTGAVMQLFLPTIDVHLQDSRLRLIADGPRGRLQMCKDHLYSIFASSPGSSRDDRSNEGDSLGGKEHAPPPQTEPNAHRAAFPLETVTEHMAHISSIQKELKLINKGVYMLSDAVLRAVPQLRRNLRNRRFGDGADQSKSSAERSAAYSDAWHGGKGGDCDELIQNCYSMASEQGLRSLPFIESARLRREMTLAIAKLAIDWVAFICDDCVPTDRKTFKWAVAALENAWNVTRAENIFHLNEYDFGLMRSKVASCMALLISQFDIMGARSSAAKTREEQERLEHERLERAKAEAEGIDIDARIKVGKAPYALSQAVAAKLLLTEGIEDTEMRWISKIHEWEEARQAIESEQRLIGRVLDETRIEDRGLQVLAQSSSRIQIRWQLGRFIGAGTFGTVYSALNLDSGDLMAVKEIRFQDIASHPTFFEQIKDEMNVMEMLSHPNIVQYYGIEVHRDKVYIFEEFCQGGSLAHLLEHGRIEDEAVIQIYTLQMLDGLVYLHSKGIVHRDIKPDNILLDHMGVIKFVDFGAAKILAKNSKTIQQSRRRGAAAPIAIPGTDGKGLGGVQSLQGTPMYMSPEIIKGEARGRRGAMDVWSVGCVVLEFATGRRPWSQLDNEWAIMFHIGMAQQHPPLPEPGQLSDLGIDFIRQCLFIDPYERPSAAEMREHSWIQNLLAELASSNEEGAAVGATAEVTVTEAPASGTMPSTPLNLGAESATGVAAMVQTPGMRTLNNYFQRSHTNTNLLSDGSWSQFSTHTTSTGTTSISTGSTVPPNSADA
ncbi:hypothetical protein K437DRAFT_256955 [Tilletiaria anomala UBC 951]|uniref:Protein kinase domain-containing protein n=1 Tax=Tilletiaria anomala (strain ATCC 24038 / CBS 436.72 / UBC 951) TaxID=1037660 RepID=A0A066VWP2_TILAU|nr:uncharacterized protein K437DRAFT_256955 [Tilletiaria anomala UBC 951]KDN44713.1 hypothetical protein K437DRAFT_256955 [Tilletiaria anomala UBC 951]